MVSLVLQFPLWFSLDLVVSLGSCVATGHLLVPGPLDPTRFPQQSQALGTKAALGTGFSAGSTFGSDVNRSVWRWEPQAGLASLTREGAGSFFLSNTGVEEKKNRRFKATGQAARSKASIDLFLETDDGRRPESRWFSDPQ